MARRTSIPHSIAFCAALLTICGVVAAEGEPKSIASAPIVPTSFMLSAPHVAASHGRFFASWDVDTFVGHRLDGMPIDATGHAAAPVASVLASTSAVGTVLPFKDGFLCTYRDYSELRHFVPMAADGTLRRDLEWAPSGRMTVAFASEDGKRMLTVSYARPSTAILFGENGSVVRDNILLASSPDAILGVLPSGSGFLLLTRAGAGMQAQRIATDGTIDTQPVLLDSSASGGATAASDGTSTLIFWPAGAWNNTVTSGALLSSDDAVVRRLTVALPATSMNAPLKLLWTGTSYLLFLNVQAQGTAYRSIATMRFDREGKALDTAPVAVSYETFGDVAWNGSIAYMVTTAWSVTGPMVHGTALAVGTEIGVIGTETISLLPARQNSPSAASDGNRSLVAWREAGASGQTIRAALLSNGLPGAATTLATADGFIGQPVVAFGGGVYLVVWEFYHHLFGARFSANGTLLDSSPFSIATRSDGSFFRAAVASDGERFLVAWGYQTIQLALVSADGTVGPARDVTAPAFFAYQPALAWNGKRFLLAYSVLDPIPFPAQPISHIDVTALDRDGAATGNATTIATVASNAAVASNGDGFLITAVTPSAVRGVWIDAAATSIGRLFLIMDHVSVPYDAAATVAWIGDAYAVAASSYSFDGSNAGWLRLALVLPDDQRVAITRVRPSRPDHNGGPFVCIAGRSPDARAIFTDIRDDNASGGSSRVLTERIEDIPATTGRTRAVAH